MQVTIGKVAGGAAAVLGAAAVAFYVNERLSEQPAYKPEVEDGAFGIRRYPALLVAEVVRPGERKAALSSGFDRLAQFIFGKVRPDGDREKIAMTAPVLSDRAGRGWRTRFVMPQKFSAETLPAPAGDVRVAELPARRVAAIRFSGLAGDASLAAKEQELRGWMRSRQLQPAGPAEYAFYNSPFVPGPLRRNEVLIPLDG